MAVVTVAGLAKHYGPVKAVEDVSFAVEPGDIFGLLGPNGSGKTTTLACMLGLLRFDRGTIEVLGRPAADIERTAGQVAVVFDSATLVDGLTCRQNLQYARQLLGHDGGRGFDEALALTGIESLADRRAGRLSLGQRRRLSIARALIGSPKLLVLDEPLSGLDTVGVRAMLALFATLQRQGLTLIISSHRLHEMETVVNRVGVLMRGRLVRFATLDELLQGGRPRLRVRATPGELAETVLAGRVGADGFERRPGGDEFLLRPTDTDPAALNAALVGAGCAVSALVPERMTLQSAFEGLVGDEDVPP
jgi:ABC-2 type transport system ATP-binding protein